MPETFVAIEISPASQQVLRDLQAAPERLINAIRAGMDRGTQLALREITLARFTGQGPFPVAEHRLGIRTDRLRSSLRASKAVIAGNSVTSSIGTNVWYLAIHEQGADYTRTSKAGTTRLRQNAGGDLLRNPRGGAIFAKTTHKRVREVSYNGGKTYSVHVPARAPLSTGAAEQIPAIVAEIDAELAAMGGSR